MSNMNAVLSQIVCFVPTSVVATPFCYPCPQFCQTCKKKWNKKFVSNLSLTQKCRGVLNLGDIRGPIYRCTTSNPSNYPASGVKKYTRSSALVECHLAVWTKTLRTRRKLWKAADQTVVCSSEVTTAEFLFCVTNLGTPCIINNFMAQEEVYG